MGTRVAEDGSEEVSGIVPQSLVELFRLIAERMEDQAGCGKEQEMGDGEEVWTVRVGYLQVCAKRGMKRSHLIGPKGTVDE